MRRLSRKNSKSMERMLAEDAEKFRKNELLLETAIASEKDANQAMLEAEKNEKECMEAIRFLARQNSSKINLNVADMSIQETIEEANTIEEAENLAKEAQAAAERAEKAVADCENAADELRFGEAAAAFKAKQCFKNAKEYSENAKMYAKKAAENLKEQMLARRAAEQARKEEEKRAKQESLERGKRLMAEMEKAEEEKKNPSAVAQAAKENNNSAYPSLGVDGKTLNPFFSSSLSSHAEEPESSGIPGAESIPEKGHPDALETSVDDPLEATSSNIVDDNAIDNLSADANATTDNIKDPEESAKNSADPEEKSEEAAQKTQSEDTGDIPIEKRQKDVTDDHQEDKKKHAAAEKEENAEKKKKTQITADDKTDKSFTKKPKDPTLEKHLSRRFSVLSQEGRHHEEDDGLGFYGRGSLQPCWKLSETPAGSTEEISDVAGKQCTLYERWDERNSKRDEEDSDLDESDWDSNLEDSDSNLESARRSRMASPASSKKARRSSRRSRSKRRLRERQKSEGNMKDGLSARKEMEGELDTELDAINRQKRNSERGNSESESEDSFLKSGSFINSNGEIEYSTEYSRYRDQKMKKKERVKLTGADFVGMDNDAMDRQGFTDQSHIDQSLTYPTLNPNWKTWRSEKWKIDSKWQEPGKIDLKWQGYDPYQDIEPTWKGYEKWRKEKSAYEKSLYEKELMRRQLPEKTRHFISEKEKEKSEKDKGLCYRRRESFGMGGPIKSAKDTMLTPDDLEALTWNPNANFISIAKGYDSPTMTMSKDTPINSLESPTGAHSPAAGATLAKRKNSSSLSAEHHSYLDQHVSNQEKLQDPALLNTRSAITKNPCSPRDRVLFPAVNTTPRESASNCTVAKNAANLQRERSTGPILPEIHNVPRGSRESCMIDSDSPSSLRGSPRASPRTSHRGSNIRAPSPRRGSSPKSRLTTSSSSASDFDNDYFIAATNEGDCRDASGAASGKTGSEETKGVVWTRSSLSSTKGQNPSSSRRTSTKSNSTLTPNHFANHRNSVNRNSIASNSSSHSNTSSRSSHSSSNSPRSSPIPFFSAGGLSAGGSKLVSQSNVPSAVSYLLRSKGMHLQNWSRIRSSFKPSLRGV